MRFERGLILMSSACILIFEMLDFPQRRKGIKIVQTALGRKTGSLFAWLRVNCGKGCQFGSEIRGVPPGKCFGSGLATGTGMRGE